MFMNLTGPTKSTYGADIYVCGQESESYCFSFLLNFVSYIYVLSIYSLFANMVRYLYVYACFG